MREFQILACVDAEGVVVRKFVLTVIEASALSPDQASEAGFTLSEDESHYARELSEAVIAYETRFERHAATHLLPAKLKVVDGVVEQSPDFPADTTFRRAWIWTGGAIGHDMEKARELHRNVLRKARAPLLAELDVAYQRSDERGDVAEKAGISARKQALRDVTDHPDIAHAATIESLKALTIPLLTGEASEAADRVTPRK